MPNVRGPSRDHSSAAGSKPDPDQRAAVHRPPAVRRRPPGVRHRRRRGDPNSSRATHNAILGANPSPDDTTVPMPAWVLTSLPRTRRSRPRKSRPARGKIFSAWSSLLPDPTTRRTYAAIRSDISRTTGAAGQSGKQTDTGKHGRPSAIRSSHLQLLNDCGSTYLSFAPAKHGRQLHDFRCEISEFRTLGTTSHAAVGCNEGPDRSPDAQRRRRLVTTMPSRCMIGTDFISGSSDTDGSNTSLPVPEPRYSRSASEPGRPAKLS